ncbi:MAG: BtaA family protein [Anaerolineaceae bacterium]|nr:BtaA family protein [Anaerolineaceae bacterium]MCB9098100.1 BtaA family protein [Anaerolineales bacterium]
MKRIKKIKTAQRKWVNTTHDFIFKNIHSHRLIYNQCWEDPRIDRQLLQIKPDSKLVMITSAGCNALDYLLDSPETIHCVDVNPRQNALLHLKLAFIQHGDFDNLFTMFGVGGYNDYQKLYRQVRDRLPDYAQGFWDEKIYYFDQSKPKKSFYYHGTSGDIAWLLSKCLLQTKKQLRRLFFDLIEANDLAEQKEIYARMEPTLWNSVSCWLIKHPLLLAMLGVPRPQIKLIEKRHPDGVVGYVRDNLKRVFTEVLMHENYFWRVYLTGSYSRSCCPNYLKPANLDLLQANNDRIESHTTTLAGFLKENPGNYSHFILLDHQDWLAWHDPNALREEWQLILENSQVGTKILMRSAGSDINFIPNSIQTSLRFFPQLTLPLHQLDRVGTYGSLHLAEVI